MKQVAKRDGLDIRRPALHVLIVAFALTVAGCSSGESTPATSADTTLVHLDEGRPASPEDVPDVLPEEETHTTNTTRGRPAAELPDVIDPTDIGGTQWKLTALDGFGDEPDAGIGSATIQVSLVLIDADR